MTIQVLSIDHMVPHTILRSELAPRAISRTVDQVVIQLGDSAEDQGLDPDWTTFSLTIAASETDIPALLVHASVRAE